MSLLARRMARFLLVFAIALAALVPLWSVLASTYTQAVSALARPGFRAVEPDHVTVLDAQRDELWIYRRVGERSIAPFTIYDRYAFFAVLPLVAMLVATPGIRWRRRLLLIAIAVVAQGVTHAALVVASIELAYVDMGLAAVGTAAARILAGVEILVRLLWEASPVALWIALTFGAWKRLWADARTRTGTKEPRVHLREGRAT